jgi:long-chain acyl-CoA synthetase
VPDVDVPPPPQLVPALLDRLRRPQDSPPLAVIDPTWPTSLRERAMADLADAVATRRLAGGDLVLFTSGSSGSPRAVVRTVESWRASLEPLSELTGIGPPDGTGPVWVPGPITSSLFLYGALHAAWLGLPWAGGRQDAPLVERATSAHLVPTQLADAVDAREHGLLPRLRTVVVAGAHLPASLRRRAARSGLRVVEYYGAAELSFVGWRDDDGPFRDFPGARVRIDDDDRSLWVRSPYVARASLRPGARGSWRQHGDWHTVGDLGRAENDGWRVLGRGQSVVTTGGHTIVVAEVETVLRQVPGVRDVAVVGLPHPRLVEMVVAVVVPEGSSDTAVRRRLEEAARELPAAARPRRWLRAGRLPQLASGKVDRAALTAAAAELPTLR